MRNRCGVLPLASHAAQDIYIPEGHLYVRRIVQASGRHLPVAYTTSHCFRVSAVSNVIRMSISGATATDNVPPSTIPENVFDEHVFYNREICSQCFSRIRTHDDFRPDTDGGVSKYAPEDRWRRSHDGVSGEAIVSEFDDYGYRCIYDDRTFCGNCGSESGHADISEALSKDQAERYAYALVDRLQEEGYNVGLHKVVSDVGHYKTQPWATNYDVHIFRLATTMAVRWLMYGYDD